ncbi:unnamed protein product [Spodoptera littoralis]|uniref:Uncharacterized protein n=1 Tax=Spodoptera littoralis TaxID=7109 RepID=A0A9P0HZE3_SPOLI|nr:unnamed protein product [Spodoptera littoralis]CAH1637001.1 unnamed protein product [Spodoptera littoralis]
MEKSNSNTVLKHTSGDEGGNQGDDDIPTTSRGDNFNPEQISHNMNDFKALDFNSADEVRQAMKVMLSGKMPPQSFAEEGNKFPSNNEPVKINETNNSLRTHSMMRPVRLIHNKFTSAWNFKRHAETEVKSLPENTTLDGVKSSHKLPKPQKESAKNSRKQPKTAGDSTRRKRPGRPPKAGPSKAKKPNIKSMYLGKLSNVVPFKRQLESGSESDVESVIVFY